MTNATDPPLGLAPDTARALAADLRRISRLPDTTVVVLTGTGMRYISQAAALARRFQPAMVVLEDVDLVANDRSFGPAGNPLLFSLLDAMDGIGADADVTFVLTTNRADMLTASHNAVTRSLLGTDRTPEPSRPEPGQQHWPSSRPVARIGTT